MWAEKQLTCEKCQILPTFDRIVLYCKDCFEKLVHDIEDKAYTIGFNAGYESGYDACKEICERKS